MITFGVEGNRDALISASRPGDLVLFVGTETADTALEDRGRLLGLAEIGRNFAVDTLDAVDPTILVRAHYNEQNQIRWPKALAMLHAWRFVPAPRLRDVLVKQLTYEATVRAVLLDEVDTRAVLALAREEVAVREYDAVTRLRALNDALRVATTGPQPVPWFGETERNTEEVSFTYVLQFGSRSVWKVGHAKDLSNRLAEIRKHVPDEVLHENWRLVLHQRWGNEQKAYEMEQRVLQLLRTPDCVGERVLCGRKQLEQAWVKALVP